jgi:hypothetical protein
MSRAIAALSVLGLSALSSLAAPVWAASCYVLYDRNDQVIYRDLSTPIDLSKPIGPQVNAKWSGGALVIVGDAGKCVPLDLRAGRPTVSENTEAAVEGATKTASTNQSKKRRSRT